MFNIPLGPDDTALLVAPYLHGLRSLLQVALFVLVLAAPLLPIGLIVWLYRYELRLVSFPQACGLLALRLAVVLVLWIAIGLQPQVAGTFVEETPGRVRIAVDLSASMNVTDVDQTRSRKQILEDVLSPQGKNLLARFAERHEVEIVGFHQDAADLQASQLLEYLTNDRPQPETNATNLHLPLAKTSARRDSPLLGIVLFSDGQHNVGPPPYERAKELRKEGVPIFPVVIGSRTPPNDLMIQDVQAPTKVFKDATAQIDIGAKITNLPPQELTIEMTFNGKKPRPEHRKVIQHDGKDRTFNVPFEAKMDEVGTHLIEIKATSAQNKEITLANNTASRVLRVADDKAKALIIDGEARWEYHYLAVALLRDPTIAVERVVFTQPRIGAIKVDQLDKAGLAKTKLPEIKADRKDHDPLLDFDCIFLGDVSPEDLPIVDRRRLERYVSERGGTLVMIAGKRYLPIAYAKMKEDPLANLLPFTEPVELNKDTGFALSISGEGKQRPFLQLEPGQDGWPELPKHFWGVAGKRKPGASVLASPAPEKGAPVVKNETDTGIILQQNYGFGRVLYVGIDSTWRWRFRVGDTYHHRFWGQLARWSAADKMLPAGNRFVRFGSREPVYSEGQEVELAVRLVETLPPLKDAGDARVKLFRKKPDGSEELIAVVPLAKNPRQANLLEAKVRDLSAGVHRVELDIPQYRDQIAFPPDDKDAKIPDRDLFRILPRPQTELLNLSTNWQLMQGLAEHSKGTLYTPENVDEIIDRLASRIERTEYQKKHRPWADAPTVWWMLGLLLGLLTAEWVWRRWLELA